MTGAVLTASLAAGLLVHGPGAAPSSVAAEPPVADGPNIVLITTDDQRTDDMAWMPRTRRKIGRHGVEFPNSIAPNPLCCPARAIWLSGQYSHNNGIWTNGHYDDFDPTRTIAVWLHDSGYRTAFVGKFLNGYSANRDGMLPGWDIFNPQIWPYTYHYFKYSMFNSGSVETPGEYLPDHVSERGSDYIREFAKGDDPFFVWVSHFAPHGSCAPDDGIKCDNPRPLVAPRHRDKFEHARSPSTMSPAFNEDDVSDKHQTVRHRMKRTARSINSLHRDRIRSLQAVDEGVADLIATLRDTGELDNTVIIFSSDNGFLMGEHRLLRKTYAYQSSLRVPLLIRGPGIPKGVVREQIATGVDLAPTILELAGVEGGEVDGTSLMPMFDNDSAGEPRTVLLQTGIRRKEGWFYRGVTTGRYTYLKYEDNGFVELYDHHRDPYELENVAREWRYAAVRRELAARTRKLAGCSGDSCRTEFGPVPKVWG